MAALSALHDEAVHLPTAEEKETQACSEWRDGFLLVDGMKITIFQRPGLHGDAWFDKNKDYSLDCQLITVPDTSLIVDYSLGHTGSVHDSWAFRSTRTFKESRIIFEPGEWIWANSAYPVEKWCVSPFKKPTRRELSPDQRTYNYHVSKVCIRSEHAIGLLKGRFQALCELRVLIATHQHHQWTIMEQLYHIERDMQEDGDNLEDGEDDEDDEDGNDNDGPNQWCCSKNLKTSVNFKLYHKF
ncbi:hypothetical protein FIBSPDRAFT_1024780 [Athelia psychrophila]|uniref:DDE Tnp4 domain-containing protein n=1 Tax=Athelia psychrophila TaxID=1759441 RepID=A0A166IC93_9AGAM|nr:hypothetical protein FIBSPDRAFT_1024780 [Fibularhizoctonia sp. CBS 109695]